MANAPPKLFYNTIMSNIRTSHHARKYLHYYVKDYEEVVILK